MILREKSSRGEGSWDEFLSRHSQTLWQRDFRCGRSKGWWICTSWFSCTWGRDGSGCRPVRTSPTRRGGHQWRNFLQHDEDVDLPVEIVMRDNDGKYPAQFDEMLKSGGGTIKRNMPWSPNLQAHVKRVIQT